MKIFDCCIELTTEEEIIDSSDSRAQLFIDKQNSAEADWYIHATIGTHVKYNLPNEQCFIGESFGDCPLEYRWHIFQFEGLDILRIEYQHADPWQFIEAAITGNRANVQYIPASHLVPKQINPYTFPFSNLLYSRILNNQHGLLIHASGVIDGENGYLFTAVSGTGKSTMARLWQKKGCQIINDDIIAITTRDGINIHNIPMPHYVDRPKCAPLKAIFLIKQSPVNYINPLGGALAAMQLMANCIQQFSDPQYIQRHLGIVSAIAAQVPIFEAGFIPDTNIVDMIRENQSHQKL